jgi:hypothetical protein
MERGVLILPRGPLRHGISARRAIGRLKDRIKRGDMFLEANILPPLLPEFRRDVLRWQAENEELVGMLFVPDGAGAGAASDGASLASAEERIEALKDDVSRDVGVLSTLVARLELEIDADGGEAASPSSTGSATVDDDLPSFPAAAGSAAGDNELPVGTTGGGPTAALHSTGGSEARQPEGEQRPITEHLQPADSEGSEAEVPVPPLVYSYASGGALAGYDADAVASRDLVGVARVVDAFSYLMAARALQPPLAIGLFGEWGSGKSFLMGAIRRRVDEITKGARQSGRTLADMGVYTRIVQIEFNAWHYVEGNLWASLVDHILSNLRTSADEDTTELDRRKRAIAGELASTRDQQRVLNRRLEELKDARIAKEREVTDLQQRRADKLVEVQQLRVSDIAAVALDATDRAAVDEALGHAGVLPSGTSAAEAGRRLQAAREVAVRGSTVLAPMRRYGWRWVALLVAAVAIAPLTAVALDSTALSGITKALASIGALLTAVAAIAGTGARLAARALDKIEAAQARVDERVQREAREHATRIAQAQDAVSQYEHEIGEAMAAHQDAVARIEDLDRQLEELTPGKLLAEFLERRTTSGDYRKHLGLTAMIRRDFEELSKLVADNNEALLENDAATGSADFNRIVLYVDDLDRCPPRRVVQVLQAVHLLLSFSVFVVVLAVDPRWLAQSLEIEYRKLLGGEGADGARRQATPEDYLEKIFQIPFRMEPLDVVARTRFVEGLLGADLAQAPDGADTDGVREYPDRVVPAANAVDHDAAGSREADAGAAGVAASRAADAAADDSSNATDDQDGHGTATVGDTTPHGAVESEWRDVQVAADDVDRSVHTDAGEARVDVRALYEGDRSAEAPPVVDLNPASLRFTPEEGAFLDELLPLLGTSPRGLKRYVNIYRLVKSVAAIDGVRHPGPEPAPFEAAMLMLAVQNGLAETGLQMVRRVAASADVPVPLRDAVREAPGDTSALLGWLDQHPDIAAWPLPALAPHARQVSLYAFG